MNIQLVNKVVQFVLRLSTNKMKLVFFCLKKKSNSFSLHSASFGQTHPLALAEKCKPGVQ